MIAKENGKWENVEKRVHLEDPQEKHAKMVENLDEKVPKHSHVGRHVRVSQVESVRGIDKVPTPRQMTRGDEKGGESGDEDADRETGSAENAASMRFGDEFERTIVFLIERDEEKGDGNDQSRGIHALVRGKRGPKGGPRTASLQSEEQRHGEAESGGGGEGERERDFKWRFW